MTLQAAAPSLTTPDRELAEDLPSLAAVYRLAPVRTWTRLPHGMMNPNWRLETDSGPLVLKRVMDVSLDKARRNLSAPMLLAEAGIPVCAPKRTSGGDVVAEVGDRGYCLFAWVDGEHVTGHSLPLGQVADLGRLTGRLHVALRDVAVTAGWPAVPSEVRAKVCAPQAALAEAERFLGITGSMARPDRFDLEAARWLEVRRVLIDKYAWLRQPTSWREARSAGRMGTCSIAIYCGTAGGWPRSWIGTGSRCAPTPRSWPGPFSYNSRPKTGRLTLSVQPVS